MFPKIAVLGFPVSQSLSPLLHGYWLEKYSIAGSYGAIEISPDAFVMRVRALIDQGYSGFNITVPHKEVAYQFVDFKDETAERVKAVNTIVVRDKKTFGYNTDLFGFERALFNKNASDFSGKNALVLGAGGASRAILAALLSKKLQRIFLANRSLDKSENLSKEFGARVQVIEWNEREKYLPISSILVNTTTLGMQNQPPLDIDIAALPSHATVCDIVYKPFPTSLLKDAMQRNLVVMDGLDMLIYQAIPGFKMWFAPEWESDKEPVVDDHLKQFLLSKIGA